MRISSRVPQLRMETLFPTVPVSEAWQADGEGCWRLSLRQTEAGCEERVRLCDISAGRYRAFQTESRARAYRFTVAPEKDCGVLLSSAQADNSEPAVFLRTEKG